MSMSQSSKPVPDDLALPVGSPLSISGRFLRRMLRATVVGRITLQLPSGERVEHEAPNPGPHAILVLNTWRTVRRVVLGGHLAFAEAYIDGDWDSPDLAALIEFFALNQDHMRSDVQGSWLSRQWNLIRHRTRGNTKRGSKRNIVAHYDLGNDFYATWLDRGMTYSSAVYQSEGQSLEAAQDAKIGRVIEALELRGGEEVLEIGCGWGALAERLISDCDAKVTGVTLSPAQLHYAKERLAKAGLDARGDLRLEDYRDVRGVFDRIVSIEMLEAVGAEYWAVYFATLRDRLAKGGHAVLQVISIAERYFEAYTRETDFIQKYIFPGGMLPSVPVLRQHIAKAGLMLKSAEMFGESYAITLGEWQRRFQHAWPSLAQQGFDTAFRRKWEYYLSYCEAGFRAGSIDVGLYVVGHAPEAA
jgi:cyclopropane-fatty-acyl-phospholipid synthase